VYDRTPTVDPNVVEKEYAKLEPYLNIYTSKVAHAEEKSKKELDDMRQQLSSLNSQVDQLTSMLNVMSGSKIQTKKFLKIKSVKKLQEEGFLAEK